MLVLQKLIKDVKGRTVFPSLTEVKKWRVKKRVLQNHMRCVFVRFRILQIKSHKTTLDVFL